MTRRKKAPAAECAHAPELTLQDYRLLAEFRYLLARFLAFSEEAARAEGLAPRQHQVLLAIKGYPGGGTVTVGDLSQRLCIRHNSTVELANRLERMGLITRFADQDDARRVTLALTAKSERILSALSAAHRSELRRLMPLLKPVFARLGE